MGTSDVLKVLKIARAVGECNLRTFKTSQVTINHEMHEQVHTVFYLLYSQQNYSNALLCSSSYYSSFGFSFNCPCLPDIQPGLCSFQRVFVFRIFVKLLNDVWFDKANRLSAIFFHVGVQIWRLPCVSMATSVLHSITYLCIRHWPIRNKIFC